jgi:hypothetical protein
MPYKLSRHCSIAGSVCECLCATVFGYDTPKDVRKNSYIIVFNYAMLGSGRPAYNNQQILWISVHKILISRSQYK